MSSSSKDIAIVGMSCLYPNAPDLASFWENILAGVDALGEPPEGTVADDLLDPGTEANDRLYTTRGGYVGELTSFDPMKFGVVPRSVDGGEPEHFVALQLAHDALEDAGYLERDFDRERTEVILGRGTYANRGFVTVLQHTFALDQLIRILSQLHPEHTAEELAQLKAKLKESLPPFNAETAASLPHSVMCGRIANRLDLMGPAYSVDGACASALIATDLGMKDLSSGACDLALVGAIQISTTFPIALLFSQLGALSRSGQLRPFHSEADGTLLGEGAGVLVLKRLEDAEADGDRVYAVLKGVGTSSDGRAMGLLAPRLEGEELAMRRAYERADVAPSSIGLVEAHGTGTPVGDEIELQALAHIFGNDTSRGGRRPLGAVKSMIGHCIPAAGAAGLIKAALAVYHRVIPPTLHADSPHPALAETPFYLPPEARPWIHGYRHPRRAAVSAFGFGGINGHAILQEHEPSGKATEGRGRRRNLHARWDHEVLLVSGGDRGEIRERCRSLLRYLEGNPETVLRDLAYTLNTRLSESASECLAIVASDPAEAGKKLEYAARKLADSKTGRIRERSGVYYNAEPLARGGQTAFLFPGEGSQYPGMLSDVCIHFSEAREWFDLMDSAFRDHDRGVLPSQSVFPIPGSPEPERLWQMDGAIEAVFAANQAMRSVLASIGLRPQSMVGHSTGEYSALLASGAARVEDGGHLAHHVLEGNRATERAQAAGLVPDGVLLAVGPADPERVAALAERVGGDVYLAMDNCPHQAVLWGRPEEIDGVEQELRESGVVCQKLPFSRAYHTPLFAPVCDELEEFYSAAEFARPTVPLYSCVTAARVPEDPEAIRRLALEHWARPVRFRETIEAMYADGARIFVEVGPASNLTAFVTDILRGREHLAVSTNTRRRSGIEQLNHLIGQLAAHGVDMSLASLYERRNTELLDPEEVFAGRKSSRVAAQTLKLSLVLPEMELPAGVAAKATEHVAPLQAAVGTTTVAAASSGGVRTAVEAMADESAASGTSVGVAATSLSARARVMSEHNELMERFLETEEQVLRSVLRRSSAVAGDGDHEIWPLAGARVEALPSGGVSVSRRLNLGREIFLLDHTLGGAVSENPTLRALPVLPLAMSLEMMAQTARLVRSADGLDEIRSLKVHRWLPFDRPAVDVELVAEPAERAEEVRVQLFARSARGERLLTVSGAFLLRRSEATRAQRGDFPLASARPSRWSPDQLYSEGLSHGMFHGPSLRGVASLGRVGDDGIEGKLRVGAADGLVRDAGRFGNRVAPLLIDAVSQLVGYWTAETLERNFVVFPTGFDRLRLFAEGPGLPMAATGRARCRELDEQRFQADLEVVGEDGALLLSVEGWEVTRAPLPDEVYAFRLAPREVLLGKPLPEKLLDPIGAAGCRLDLSERFLAVEEGIWLESLAHLALSPGERETWLKLSGDEARRRAWFSRRMATKDAIRLLMKARGAGDVYPADVEPPTPNGRAEGWPLHAVAQQPGVALAVASHSGSQAGLGIEFRRVGEPGDPAALSASEDERLRELPVESRREWAQRMGCAKSAAMRALESAGLSASAALEVYRIDAESEIIGVTVDGIDMEVPTILERDLIIAAAKWEREH